MKIDEQIYQKIVQHALNDAPIEACGYLAESEGVIVEAYPMKNMDASGEHFSFDPKEQFDVVRLMRSKGQRTAAVYHSHPETPARLSQEDIRLALDKSLSYVIISLAEKDIVVKTFRFANDAIVEEDVFRVNYARVEDD